MQISSLITISLCLLVSGITQAKQNDLKLVYDEQHDRVTLQSNQSQLKGILGSLSIHAGIETSLHPDADRPVSINIENKSLSKTITELCKPLNCIVHYEKDNDTQLPVIIGLDVLPAGNEQSDMLEPVIPISTELAMHARMHQSSEIHRLIQKRLEIRLNQLPADQKQQVLNKYEQKIKHYQERSERHARRKQEMQQQLHAEEQREITQREALKETDPAAYEAHLQRQQQAELLYGPHGQTNINQ